MSDMEGDSTTERMAAAVDVILQRSSERARIKQARLLENIVGRATSREAFKEFIRAMK